jgi:APA family basic amino acid/polyamine antiporter
VADGWSGYFQNLIGVFGWKLPHAIAGPAVNYDPQLGRLVATGSVLNLPAVFIVILITVILIVGIRESASVNTALVAIKVAAVLFVIGVGAFYVNPANWHPFAPYGLAGLNVFGHVLLGQSDAGGKPLGMLAGAALAFFAYIGFDSVLTGMVPYDQLDINAPVADAFRRVGLRWAQALIALAGLAGITSVILVTMLSQARILLAIARDGLLPPGFFAAVHERFRTPWKSTLVTGVFVGSLAAFLPISVLLMLVNMGTLFAFVIVCAAVLIMRRRHPEVERPFRVPFVPLVPILGIASCILLMFSLPSENWLRLFVWLAIGLMIYFLYGRRHSTLARLRARE